LEPDAVRVRVTLTGEPSSRCPLATGRYPAGEERVNKISVAPLNGVRGDDGPWQIFGAISEEMLFS
jgi:hypothetical protein